MLQPCHTHTVPLLRPYPHRDAKTALVPSKNSQFLQNFNISECPVAKYILEQNPRLAPDKIKFNNGSLTELGKHCLKCEVCTASKTEPEQTEVIEIKSIELNLEIFNEFKKWKFRECSTQTDSQAILILLKYKRIFDKEISKLRKYESRYGELK